MTEKIALLWFRQDLRLKDNPALIYALEKGYTILPVFILDDNNAGEWKRGGASRWWLHQSLKALNADLDGGIIFKKGEASKIIPNLVKETGAQAVFWNRCYEPWRINRDKAIKEHLKDDPECEVKTFNASLLWEPWDIKKSDGTPYKVFTPYYRKGCLGKGDPAPPQERPDTIPLANYTQKTTLDDLSLMPNIKWFKGMESFWTPGENGAQERLSNFLEDGLKGYKEKRNYPDEEHVSYLSPHLHFGEISPRDAWHSAQIAGIAQGAERDLDNFCSELGWREFSYALLYHNPQITREPLQTKFKEFPWNKDDKLLERWKTGRTGYPIIDAGMRQLWETGWMHNRVRMIVASFLIKNLLLHWHEGEDWFWDTLVDADLANNSASWQWVAGSGADAAPYFRIFNPVTQSQKFDQDGAYIRRYVPELKALPAKYIHAPWDAPPLILRQAGITLDEHYPRPITDLKKSREAALAAFQSIRSA